MFVSVTRLRLRAWWYLPAFLLSNEKTVKQIRDAAGFRKGSEVVDRKLTFWTVTLWENEGAMKGFRGSGAHIKVMPKLASWCDEASVAHWNAEDLPGWEEAHRRLVEGGRSSRVDKPSALHAARQFPPPRTSVGRPLIPSGA